MEPKNDANGANIEPVGSAEDPEVRMEILPGDLVAIRREYRSLPPRDLSANALCNVGLPNEFQVVSRGPLKDKATGKVFDCITLSPCCLRLRNPATGQFMCMGHSVAFFEKIDIPDEPDEASAAIPGRKPDKFFTVESVIGELVGCSYWKDEERLVLRLPGVAKPLELGGGAARILGNLFKDMGVL